MTFSSLNQMNFKETSRRDDLISLCYLLFTLLNDFKYPCKYDDSIDPLDDSSFADTKTKYLFLMDIK